jgi:Na+-transporting NADH:ubiquinone oxidoreductase subunit NqrB
MASENYESRGAIMKRPLGVTVVAVLMCIGAGLLAVGSLGFFVLGGVVVAAEAGGPTSQLFAGTGPLGAGIFLVLAVIYATFAICVFGLVYWARLAAIVFIAVGLLFAAIGIADSLPHPDSMVLAWQLFVIAVDAWILWYLATQPVRDTFAARRHDPGARIEAHT